MITPRYHLAHRRGRSVARWLFRNRTRAFLDWRVQSGGGGRVNAEILKIRNGEMKRKVFKQAAALASADGGDLRPAHLLLALIESGDPVVFD